MKSVLRHYILAFRAGEEALGAVSWGTWAELAEHGGTRALVPVEKTKYFVFSEEKALTALLPTQ